MASSRQAQVPAPHWLEAAENPWGVRVLDVRPVTLGMLSSSTDPRVAANAVSFGNEDGSAFVDQIPPAERTVQSNLTFPSDGNLLDGVLFVPSVMEHKWAIFFHDRKLYFVRSWTRQVLVVASIEQHPSFIKITQIQGTFGRQDEEPEFTIRTLDFLLRSHALGMIYPAPLPHDMQEQPEKAALYCMSMFGRMAHFATPHPVLTGNDLSKPLRSNSLLHIAVARADESSIRQQLESGVAIDTLAGDGLSVLHWALASSNPVRILELLLDSGAFVDVQSTEGATPLMNAVQNPDGAQTEILRLLLDRGADVNATDQRGFTCLHRASEMGRTETVKFLLDRGANPTLEAQGGHTAASLAQTRGHQVIVDLLEQHSTPSA